MLLKSELHKCIEREIKVTGFSFRLMIVSICGRKYEEVRR
jgi:hypothetical protein